MAQRWNLNFSSLTAININYKDITSVNKKNRIHHAEENLPKQKVVHLCRVAAGFDTSWNLLQLVL